MGGPLEILTLPVAFPLEVLAKPSATLGPQTPPSELFTANIKLFIDLDSVFRISVAFLEKPTPAVVAQVLF